MAALKFANVEKILPPRKAGEKRIVKIDGLATLAALDAHIDALDTLRATLRKKLDESILAEHVREGMALKCRPENFEAVDGLASAACMLKRKATGTQVSPEVAKLLRAAGITIESKPVIADQLVWNTKYQMDSKVMKRAEANLNRDLNLPKDLILHQVGTAVQVLGDAALDELFKNDAETIKLLLPVVSTAAVQPHTNAGPVEIAALVRKAVASV